MQTNKKILLGLLCALFLSIFSNADASVTYYTAECSGPTVRAYPCDGVMVTSCDNFVDARINYISGMTVELGSNTFNDVGYLEIIKPDGSIAATLSTPGVACLESLPTDDITRYFSVSGVYRIHVNAHDDAGDGVGAIARITTTTIDPLSISASPASITSGVPTSVQFTVTSVGVPVSGVTVTLSGGAVGSCTTDPAGKCSLSIIAASNVTATASKAGYYNASTTITVGCSPHEGEPCTSAPNACGQTRAGVKNCSGICAAVKPPDTDCPSCTLAAADSTVYPGETTVLSWTANNADSGVINPGAISLTMPPYSGSVNSPPITGTTNFFMNVSGGGVPAACGPVIVGVLVPPVGGLVPCGRLGDNPSTTYNEMSPCRLCHVFILLDNVVDFLLINLLLPIAVLMLIVAGIMYLGAVFEFIPGGFETLNLAKKIIISVVIGIIIIFAAFVLVGLFLKLVGLAEWTTNIYQDWWTNGLFNINCAVP